MSNLRDSALLVLASLLFVGTECREATAQLYTDIYTFDYIHGCTPEYPNLLAQGRDGNLYSTTYSGGNDGHGVVFEITPQGAETVLYNFDISQSYQPPSGLTLGTDGNFRGTTFFDDPNGDPGTIFEITPDGNLTTLYNFSGGSDGQFPYGPPVQGPGGFYGTTGTGTTYRITQSGNFISLSSIPSSYAPLLLGSDGNFYGTTISGGSYAMGTVFKMTRSGVVTIVHSFDGNRGEQPIAPVIQADDGNLYGTTYAGGLYGTDASGGVVFRLTPQGVLTVLHNFPDPSYPNDGNSPWAGIVAATDGNLYGVTYQGGTTNHGVMFRITPSGAYSIIRNFDGLNDGGPRANPMQHTNGKIYGMTEYGGFADCGVVYTLDLGLSPFVRLVSSLGKIGQTGGILGQGLTGTTSVMLNGIRANFTVVSDTYIEATVPAGATTGYATVTTPSGVLTSNVPFHVIP